jgi:hypothetical protein
MDNLFESVKRNYKAGLIVEIYQHPMFRDGIRGVIHAMHEDNTIAEVAIDGKAVTTMIPIIFLAIKKYKIEGKITTRKTPMTAEQKKFFTLGILYGKAHGLASELGVTLDEASKILVEDLEVLKK